MYAKMYDTESGAVYDAEIAQDIITEKPKTPKVCYLFVKEDRYKRYIPRKLVGDEVDIDNMVSYFTLHLFSNPKRKDKLITGHDHIRYMNFYLK